MTKQQEQRMEDLEERIEALDEQERRELDELMTLFCDTFLREESNDEA